MSSLELVVADGGLTDGKGHKQKRDGRDKRDLRTTAGSLDGGLTGAGSRDECLRVGSVIIRGPLPLTWLSMADHILGQSVEVDQRYGVGSLSLP